jgi:hypothetical protein
MRADRHLVAGHQRSDGTGDDVRSISHEVPDRGARNPGPGCDIFDRDTLQAAQCTRLSTAGTRSY